MIIFPVVQVVLSIVAFSETALTFEKILSKFRQFLPIFGQLDAWTVSSFSLVVFPYKTDEKNYSLAAREK